MTDAAVETGAAAEPPPELLSLAHVSLPCRDLEDALRFYVGVLGAAIRLRLPSFAAVRLAGAEIGLGNEGCCFLTPGAEYPHLAFYAAPAGMLGIKARLARCGIPSSNYWTRNGVEALMFFRDPSGNLIELFCSEGFAGAADLPKGPPRGHGVAVDIDVLRYEAWRLR